MNVAPNEDLRIAMLNKRFDYHFNLVARRWQYLAAFLLINGVLLNAMGTLAAKEADRPTAVLFSVGAIVAASVFLRLTSRIRQRLCQNDAELNLLAGKRVFDVPLKSCVHVTGITFSLYVAMIGMSLGWFYFLFSLSVPVFVLCVCVFIFVLVKLNWKSFTAEMVGCKEPPKQACPDANSKLGVGGQIVDGTYE